MAKVISMSEYMTVRFFLEDVLCGHCGSETRGAVRDSSEAVVCTECGGPIIEVEHDFFEEGALVTFTPEGDDA